MLAIGQQDAVNILRFFDDLPDPRSTVNRLHRLGDVIVIAICAIIATADGPTAIAEWAKLNASWLRRHLALPNGIPGKDTFRRVLGLLPPAVFQQCFQQWLQTLQVSPEGESESQKHIAIDGKTMRRSHDRKHGLGPMHIVSAWASDYGISLGQVATEEKSNEITAIPQLLDMIDVEDAIVTIDAQDARRRLLPRSSTEKVTTYWHSKAITRSCLRTWSSRCSATCTTTLSAAPVSRHIEVEEGHGRLEARTYYQITAPSHLRGRSEWKGLKTIGAAIRVYEQNGVEKRDIRYFISSLRRNGEQFANAVRSHWGIENSLHWSLDMTFREDESRVRERTFADNLSWLRRMTLSLIKQHPGKESNIMKRRMAGWSVDYLMQILTGKGT